MSGGGLDRWWSLSHHTGHPKGGRPSSLFSHPWWPVQHPAPRRAAASPPCPYLSPCRALGGVGPWALLCTVALRGSAVDGGEEAERPKKECCAPRDQPCMPSSIRRTHPPAACAPSLAALKKVPRRGGDGLGWVGDAVPWLPHAHGLLVIGRPRRAFFISTTTPPIHSHSHASTHPPTHHT